MPTKIVLYVHGYARPLVINDSREITEENKEQIKNVFKSNQISIIETDTDLAIIKPTQVSALVLKKVDELDHRIDKKKIYSDTLNNQSDNEKGFEE